MDPGQRYNSTQPAEHSVETKPEAFTTGICEEQSSCFGLVTVVNGITCRVLLFALFWLAHALACLRLGVRE